MNFLTNKSSLIKIKATQTLSTISPEQLFVYYVWVSIVHQYGNRLHCREVQNSVKSSKNGW